jgi:AraC-like DNA-binding protein
LRMKRATLLLREGTYCVAEAAGRCGCEDAAYFSRLFRKRHGVPPMRHRRSSRNQTLASR